MLACPTVYLPESWEGLRMSRTPTATEKLDLVAFLAALSLFLSTIEYVIPKPIPFLRIGLSNLPVLISLQLLPIPYLFLLVLLKILGQAMIQGSLFSYVFLLSASGSSAGAIVMILASRLYGRGISLVGISILSALANNTVQVIVAVAVVFGESGWMIAPVVVGIGVVSSLLLGLFAQHFVNSSTWVRQMTGGINPG
jgi:heptaprenyl diphosphate synthase